MCQLLALAFNEPVTPSLSFRGFRHRAKGNPHGWGLATFEGTKATIVKEPRQANDSAVVKSLLHDADLSSTIFIGHVRYASVGKASMQNTHPFVQNLNGRDLVLAHNGTLSRDEMKPLHTGRCLPAGTTDSELALCILVEWLLDENVSLTDFERIHERLRTLNKCGKMNLLFSDGAHLFAYHDEAGYTGLCYTHREAPFENVTLRDEDWSANLSEEKKPTQRGYVIATKALTDGEKWTAFGPGALMVFKDGESIYPKSTPRKRMNR